MSDQPKSTDELRARNAAIDVELSGLNTRRNALFLERQRIATELSRRAHPCACVVLNGDIGIYDQPTEERARRKGFGLGFISGCLSASLDCPKCRGSGVPETGANPNTVDWSTVPKVEVVG